MDFCFRIHWYASKPGHIKTQLRLWCGGGHHWRSWSGRSSEKKRSCHGCSIFKGGVTDWNATINITHILHINYYIYINIAKLFLFFRSLKLLLCRWIFFSKNLRSKTRCPCISWFFHPLLQLPRRCGKHHGLLITLKSQLWVEACGMASMEQVHL